MEFFPHFWENFLRFFLFLKSESRKSVQFQEVVDKEVLGAENVAPDAGWGCLKSRKAKEVPICFNLINLMKVGSSI